MHTPKSDAKIRALQKDPTVSFWLKKALKELLERDPVDACGDADLLADVMGDRWAEIVKNEK